MRELIQGKPSQNSSDTAHPQVSGSKAADPEDRGSGLPSHVLIGIGVGCAIAAATFAAAVAFILMKRRKQRKGRGIGLIDLPGESDDKQDFETSSTGESSQKNPYRELPAPRTLQEMPNPGTDITELPDTSKVEIAGKEKIRPVEI